MSRLFQHPEADDELQAALQWYAQQGGRRALRFDKKVEGVMQEIRSRPDRFPRLDAEFREAPVPKFPYSVNYRALPSGDVQVVAVAHASREPGYRRDRA